ncbi:MAG: hypothetical protein ACK49K_17570, partial [Bacteroidota bacterium]
HRMSPFHWFEVSPEEISDSLLENGTRRGFDVHGSFLFSSSPNLMKSSMHNLKVLRHPQRKVFQDTQP